MISIIKAKNLHSRLLVVAAFAIVAFIAPAAQAATPAEQLTGIQAQLTTLATRLSGLKSGAVLGASDTATMYPTCTIKTDKATYKVGEAVKVSWTTKNAQSAVMADFNPNDAIEVAGGSVALKGTTKMNSKDTAGIAQITLLVTSTSGNRSMCVANTAIVSTDSSSPKGELTALTAKLTALSKEISNTIAQMQKLNGKTQALQMQTDEVVKKIAALGGDVPSDVAVQAGFIEGSSDVATSVVTFTADFEATAVDGDALLSSWAAHNSKLSNGSVAGVFYRILNSENKVVGLDTTSVTLSSTADEDGEYYIVQEGETEDFTVTASFKPATTGSYYMELTVLQWSSEAGGVTSKVKLDTKVFRTPVANFTQLKG